MKETFKVEINDLVVGKIWYSFGYTIWRNGVIVIENIYNSSHSRSRNTMVRFLKNGGAVELALGQYI